MRALGLLLCVGCGSAGSTYVPDAGAPVDPAPMVIYDQPGTFPYGIAVDDTAIYITATVASELHRLDKDGGGDTLVMGGLTNAGRLALDGQYAYVVVRGSPPDYVDGEIVRVAKDGSSTLTLAMGLHEAHGITLDGDEVYATCSGTVVGGSYQMDGVMLRVKTDGSTPAEVLLASEDYPTMIVVDASNVYFTDQYSGTVTRCAKASCAATRTDIFTGLDQPNGLALTDVGLAFAEYHGGRILVGNTDGTGLMTLQPSRGLPHDVAYAGDGSLYWLEELTLEINRQPLASSFYFTTLAKTTESPDVIALDASYVYVTDQHAGTITRVGR